VIALVQDPIDVSEVLRSVEDNSCGAAVLFLGTVRNQGDIGAVCEIYFEAYKEMAKEALGRIEQQVIARWGVKKFTVVHRMGCLKVGEIIVAIAAVAPHRLEAFESCKYAIDSIKKTVPIWKKEISGSNKKWVEGTLLEDNQDGYV